MNVLATGADGSLCAAVARHLGERHRVRLAGRSSRAGAECGEHDYQPADLRSEQDCKALVEGMDAIIHLAAFDSEPWEGPNAEQLTLEHATLGTYILCQEARRAGVERVVVAGSLRVFDAYPEHYLIDETWKPRPAPDAAQLAPYLCEQVVREFAREGGINSVCLRFMPIGDDPERNTRLTDALHAVDCVLALPFTVPGYRWHVFHIASSPRYLTRDARRLLGFKPEGER